MAQKQISDLTTTDRLRTGTLLELQDPINGSRSISIDNLVAGIQWDTPSQIAGFTAANIAEVEANTLAARMKLCPDEIVLQQAGWQVGRYMWSSANFNVGTGYNTTASPANPIITTIFGWPCASGICIPKKVTGSLIFGARGTPTAACATMSAYRIYGLSTGVGTTGIGSPGSQGGSGLGGLATNAGSTGLKACQQPSQAHIQSLPINSNTAQGYTDAAPLGIVDAGVVAAAGSSPILNKTLYDWQVAEQPVILSPGTGLQVLLTGVPSATSQTFWHWVNIEWDEWLPIAPGDR